MARLGEAAAPQPSNGQRPTADELIDLLRQERADFRNYRQRVADERVAELERMRGNVLEPLLPVIDDLDRALAGLPEHLTDDPWVRGIGLTRSRLGQLQDRLGLEPVGVVGEQFDPTRHEAIVYEPDPDVSDATLGQVIRPGYAAGGRLLRPAQVVVRGPLLNDVDDEQQTDVDATNASPDHQPAGG